MNKLLHFLAFTALASFAAAKLFWQNLADYRVKGDK